MSEKRKRLFDGIGILCGITAIIAGLVWLTLWLLGVAGSWSVAGIITMKTNMALCLVLLGLSLSLMPQPCSGSWIRRLICGFLAVLVILVAGLTIIEHLCSYNLGLDQLLAIEAPGAAATTSPNRMGPIGAINLILLAAGLLALAVDYRRSVPYLGIMVCLIVMVPLVGFIFDIAVFYRQPAMIGIAWSTVISLLLLGLGLIVIVRDFGPIKLVLQDDLGGEMARHLLPIITLIPLLLGLAISLAQHFGYLVKSTGIGLFAISQIIVFCVMVWRSAAQLNRISAARLIAEHALRESEQRLRESSEHFRQLAEFIPNLAWIARPDGWIYWYNSRWYEYTGTTPEQMEGWGWQSVHDPLKLPEVLEKWNKSIFTKQPFDMRFPLRGKDGDFRMFLTRGMPLLTETGEVKLWFGTNTDIDEMQRIENELKESERQLRESERLYRAIGESIDYGVWICAPDGRNLYTSESFLNLVGLTQQQCSDFGCGEVLHPDDREITIDAWKECVRTEGKWNIEHLYRGVDGHWHPILARGVPVRDEYGNITCWAGINLDISEQKKVEKDLAIAKVAAENANAAKSEFLANMSHEIRTPMNAIIGMTDLTLMTELTEMQKKYLSFVKSGSGRLLALINDILDFSRIESGKLELCQTEFDLVEIVHENLLGYRVVVGDRPIIIDDFLEDGIPKLLIGDPLRLHQILANLFNNALKFTEVGKITLDLKIVEKNEESITLKFFVVDTGPGIPVDKMDKLFQSFSQLDAKVTQKHGGSGLGLAISAALVRKMGGEIGVQSEPGKGSTFYFTATFKLPEKAWEGKNSVQS